MKVLFFDLETSPLIGYAWQKYDTNLIRVKQESHLLSIAWKWQGERSAHVAALNDFPGFRKNPSDDTELVKVLHSLLDRADVVVAHNGDRFDVRKANARFWTCGLKPPSPYRSVDTLKTARARFLFSSNSLNDLSELSGLGSKVDTGSFIDLYEACMAGDQKAWAKMKRYNKHDVVLLENLYNKLRVWDAYHPNLSLDHDPDLRCPICTSKNVELRGWRALKSWKARKFVCLDCGRWSTGAREKLPGEVLA